MPEGFWKWYLILIIPSVLVFLAEVADRIRYKNKNSVSVWFPLIVICFLSTFVGLLGAVANGLYYLSGDGDDLWFVVMMSVCYVGMIIIIIIAHEKRIIYSTADDYFIITLILKDKRINIDEITRIHLSDQYLDIYLNEKRIRIGTNFLVGAEEFESYVKKYMKERCLK